MNLTIEVKLQRNQRLTQYADDAGATGLPGLFFSMVVRIDFGAGT
jgi:hypothetical protein